MKPITRKFLTALVGFAFISVGTYLAVKFANGYRPTTSGIRSTGLLAANSFPSGAQVYIDGKLTTATDDTLNLNPGEYEIEIQKDGYISWKKKLQVEKELVTQTNAVLFPSVVSLTPITQTGVANVSPSPDGTKLVYLVSDSSTPSENGLYVYHLNGGALTFRGRATQVARSIPGLLLENSSLLWSPDSTKILLSFSTGNNIMIESSRFNDLNSLKDVSVSLPITFQNWEKELYLQENEKLLLLPEEMQQIATTSAKNIYFSPDEKKMLYTATQEIIIPEETIPSLPATSTQEEQRQLEVGGIYVYDLKEDKNFRIDTEERPVELEGQFVDKVQLTDHIEASTSLLERAIESSPSAYLKLQKGKTTEETAQAFKLQYSPLTLNGYQWFTTSSHLIVNKESGVEVVEYDGTNRANLYSGPRDNNFVYPWPDGSKLIISTNLGSSEEVPLNLYAITVK
ncbi:PEGA domain-containing protein [Patescibacteria group bacterium]